VEVEEFHINMILGIELGSSDCQAIKRLSALQAEDAKYLYFDHRLNWKKTYIHQAKTNWVSTGENVLVTQQ